MCAAVVVSRGGAEGPRPGLFLGQPPPLPCIPILPPFPPAQVVDVYEPMEDGTRDKAFISKVCACVRLCLCLDMDGPLGNERCGLC